MFKVSSLTAALAVTCSIVPAAMAQDPQNTAPNNNSEAVQQLPTVVVTASRTAQPLERAIGDITVIDGVELRQNNDANILRTLARKASIQMYDNGGPQTVSGISIRGAWGDQNLVMLNGIRIN
ncbi:MAG TPA: TonB-dependent receptor plug domain-containing protein, partial [Oligella sp.]|nr:TonB-dependent receptor plug domain-containing protein [Oligella sp.]